MVFKKTGKGFSLIELAVIIAILVILALIMLPKFQESTARQEAYMIADHKLANLVDWVNVYAGNYQAEFPVEASALQSFIDENWQRAGFEGLDKVEYQFFLAERSADGYYTLWLLDSFDRQWCRKYKDGAWTPTGPYR